MKHTMYAWYNIPFLSNLRIRLLNSKWKKRHGIQCLASAHCSHRFSSSDETNLLISVCVELIFVSIALYIFKFFACKNQIEFPVIVICFSGSDFIKFLACESNLRKSWNGWGGKGREKKFKMHISIHWKAK